MMGVLGVVGEPRHDYRQCHVCVCPVTVLSKDKALSQLCPFLIKQGE